MKARMIKRLFAFCLVLILLALPLSLTVSGKRDINEAEHYFEIDDEPYSSAEVRRRFFDILAAK